jgi:hypothetical protein
MPALAALAQRVGRLRPNDKYLPGLWEKTLPLDLLWTVKSYHRSNARAISKGSPTTVRFPSWSWDSIQSPINWNPKIKSVLSSVRVRSIRYTAHGPSHLGECSEATITDFFVPSTANRSTLGSFC